MALISRRKILSLAGLALGTGSAMGAEPWTEGRHYSKVTPPQTEPQVGPGTITEVFSYGCPGCNSFLPFMQSIAKKLPPKFTMQYLPASWIPAENWPVFQRAYLTARALGVADKAHDAMFAAIWKSGELEVINPATGRPRSPLPSMQDISRFYQRVTAVPAAKFVETSTSFSVEADIRRTDALIKAVRAEITPTIVVNGKYRLSPQTAGGGQETVDLTLWLTQRA